MKANETKKLGVELIAEPEESASEGLEEAADNALRSNIIPDLPAPAFRLGYSLGWEQCRERMMKKCCFGASIRQRR